MALGRPALGKAATRVSATRAMSAMWGRIRSAPRAQFRPMAKGLAWRTLFQNASAVWPDRVRPERSVMVPEIHSGRAS